MMFDPILLKKETEMPQEMSVEELRRIAELYKGLTPESWLMNWAADEIERLRGYFESDATCPCCQQTGECEEGCTFAEDAPSDFERMTEARKALMGPNIKLTGSALLRSPG